MLQRLRNRASEEKGFTLIELLVVILIIGILAAIALPTFLGQRDKANDSSAKSDARNLVSQVESCFATTNDYTQCSTTAPTELDTSGLSGTVTASGSSTGWVIAATSSTQNVFTITKTASGVVRSCTRVSTRGGCPASLSW